MLLAEKMILRNCTFLGFLPNYSGPRGFCVVMTEWQIESHFYSQPINNLKFWIPQSMSCFPAYVGMLSSILVVFAERSKFQIMLQETLCKRFKQIFCYSLNPPWLKLVWKLSCNWSFPVWADTRNGNEPASPRQIWAQALQLCPPYPTKLQPCDPWPLTSHSQQHPNPRSPEGQP